LEKNPLDYDTWFDLLRLLEAEGDVDQIRDAYEKAISQVPPLQVRDGLLKIS
jgi:crooked neck